MRSYNRWLTLWPVLAGIAVLGWVFFQLLTALLLVGAVIVGALVFYRLRPLFKSRPPVLVHPEAFRALASAHGLAKAIVWSSPEGFSLAIHRDGATYLVQARQGEVRVFKTLDAAARYAEQMGFDAIEVRLKEKRRMFPLQESL